MINKLLKIIIIFLSIILFKYSSFATFAALLLSGASSIVYTKYTNYTTIFGFILTIILNVYFIFSLYTFTPFLSIISPKRLIFLLHNYLQRLNRLSVSFLILYLS